MHIMYVDESGDPGLSCAVTDYFILSGIVIHELRWKDSLDRLIDFRRNIRNKYGLKLREEIHCSELINKPKNLARISPNNRLMIIRDFTDQLAVMGEISIINVVIDKTNKLPPYDVFDMAWKVLLQRF
jgi:hypothetical protein